MSRIQNQRRKKKAENSKTPRTYDYSCVINKEDMFKDLFEKEQAGDSIARNTLIEEFTKIKQSHQAIPYIIKAIEDGEHYYALDLAIHFWAGQYIRRDYSEALKLFKMSYEYDRNKTAAYFIGLSYGDGSGVPRDIPKAIKWLTISADLDEPYAMYELAVLFAGGAPGIEQNLETAKLWLERCKNSKNSDSEILDEVNFFWQTIEDGSIEQFDQTKNYIRK